MIDWAARLKMVFSQRRRVGTDETDERGVLSVSSVPNGRVREKREGVSSVGVAGLLGKHGSAPEPAPSTASGCEVFEERTVIMEFDGGVTRRKVRPRAQDRTCKMCSHLGGYGTCLEPVSAGLLPGFEIIWPPAGHAIDCMAFAPKEVRVGR